MAATASLKPWADKPFCLIETPGRDRDPNTLEDAEYMAREMALLHNCMLRALNSIYQQCIHIRFKEDIRDMFKYIEIWCDWVHYHHGTEETVLFPAIEKITGEEGLMDRNVEEHHAFMGGLKDLEDYVKVTRTGGYKGWKVRVLIDCFGGLLAEHLSTEIETLLELRKYPDSGLRKAFIEFDGLMEQSDRYTLFPAIFGTGDKDAEGVEWPRSPKLVRYLVHFWYERRYRGAWRFNPSTSWGKRRPLAFPKKQT